MKKAKAEKKKNTEQSSNTSEIEPVTEIKEPNINIGYTTITEKVTYISRYPQERHPM